MEQRELGKQGLTVSALGLGCMGMSEFYGERDERESLATLKRALDLGLNFLDTADMYGPFKNEELIGGVLKGRRESIVLATKFGIIRDSDAGVRGVNGHPSYVKSACDASLIRLKTDWIDLYYQHRVDPDVPIEETVGAMAELVRQGKVRFIGLSESSTETLRRANRVHPISALQNEYSLWTRDIEDGMLATCRELGVGLVAYSPLGRGFLTGELKRFEDLPQDDYRRTSPRFQGDNFSQNLVLVKRLGDLARRKGCTTAQLALAWVLKQGDDIVPIPGTKRSRYLEENVHALAVELTAGELADIESAFPKGAVRGGRYTERGMKLLNR